MSNYVQWWHVDVHGREEKKNGWWISIKNCCLFLILLDGRRSRETININVTCLYFVMDNITDDASQ